MKLRLIMTMAILGVAVVCIGQKADPMVVSTTSGFVKGIDQEGTMAWLGIP